MTPRTLLIVSLFCLAACGGCEEEMPAQDMTPDVVTPEDMASVDLPEEMTQDMAPQDMSPQDISEDLPEPCVPEAMPAVSEICEERGAQCGDLLYTNMCDVSTPISCGGCAPGDACLENGCVTSRLYAIDPSLRANFGLRSRRDGDTLVVSATKHQNGAGARAGAVFVYERGDAGWEGVTRLEAVDAQGQVVGKTNDEFGVAVDLEDDVLVVGAPARDGNQGAVFVYERDVRDGWVLRNELEIPEISRGDRCGLAVGVSDGIIAVGCPTKGLATGVVHLFEYNSLESRWVPTRMLERPEFLEFGLLGFAIEINRNYLIVGAPGVNGPNGMSNVGAVLVYPRSAQGLSLPREVRPASPVDQGLFGAALSLEGATLALAQISNVGGFLVGRDKYTPGRVFVYDLLGEAALERASLEAPTPVDGDQFGIALTLRGDRLGVSSWGPDGDEQKYGEAYYFKRSGMEWTLESTFKSDAPTKDDAYGFSMCFDEDHILLGEPNNDDKFERAGALRLLRYDTL